MANFKMAKDDKTVPAFIKVGNDWITDISEWKTYQTVAFTNCVARNRLRVEFNPANSYNKKADKALLNMILALGGRLDFDGRRLTKEACKPSIFKPDASWNWQTDTAAQGVYNVYARVGMFYIDCWYEDVDIKPYHNNTPILKVKFADEPQKLQQVMLPHNSNLRANVLNAMMPKALKNLGAMFLASRAEK